MKNADDQVIKMFGEIAYNVLRGNVPLTAKKKGDLKKYKIELRKLASPSRSTVFKRKVCIQRGGGIVLTILGTLLSGVVGKLLEKYG